MPLFFWKNYATYQKLSCNFVAFALTLHKIYAMKLKIKKLWMLFSLLLAVAVVTSCDDDDPEPVNEEEVITTVNVTFTNQANASDVVTATFRDIDGEGGNAPVITNPSLAASATYDVTVQFLNEAESPAEDKTEEITEEDDEHQVFFVVGNGLNLTYSYSDTDANGNPLGIVGTATTGAAGTGELTILLLHEPNKTASGVSAGNPANAGGETDIEVTFDVTIQ